jgi:hypothetical protein
MKTRIVGLFAVVAAVGIAGVNRAGADDRASLTSRDIFLPPSTVSAGARAPSIGVTSGGLVISPIFDSSITSDPNATTIMNTINAAIAVYEAQFSDSITVTIKFRKMASGLGLSSTFFTSVSYSSYLAALTTHASGANDATALAKLPGGAYDPVNGAGRSGTGLENGKLREARPVAVRHSRRCAVVGRRLISAHAD